MASDDAHSGIPEGPDEQNTSPPATTELSQRGPDGKFLPGNHAAGEHLFKPGESGNPSGRPSTRRFTAKLREALDRDDGQMIKAMVNVACQRALKGDFRYFKEIIDRVEGKVPDRLAVDTEVTARTYTEVERSESRRLAMLLLGARAGPQGPASLPPAEAPPPASQEGR
jgi:hypothetical protein